MKKILGLDLGSNSIGWSLVEIDHSIKAGKIIDAGVRIIPMDNEALGKFDKGQTVSQTAERTNNRGTRRLLERKKLRRERLIRVLNKLDWLTEHFKVQIDFEKRLGQFKKDLQPKIAWLETNGAHEFYFMQAYQEMVGEFKEHHPHLAAYTNPIPYDWTIYYLRKKALTKQISKQELAWILLNFNQKRGYYQLRGEENEKENGKSYEELKVKEFPSL